jgi:hypothetical protein
LLEVKVALTSVTAEDVRDTLNVNESDIPEAKVLRMIKRAAVTVGLELTTTIDSNNCTDAQKEAITDLAAIYALCFLTGGSAVGLNFSVGDLNTTVSSRLPSLDVLQGEFKPSARQAKNALCWEGLAPWAQFQMPISSL